MIRFLFYVALVFIAAAAFAWLAERPGDLALTWQGYEIRTTLMVAAIGVFVIVVGLSAIGAAVRAVVGAPRAVSNAIGARRRDRGYRALSRGMVAVGAGDARAARRAAHEARSLLGDDPLVLLLTAQTAQIGGDREAARNAFERLSDSADTRVLGLHGLFVEATRQGEHGAAMHFAEEAHRLSADIAWAGQALFDYRSRAGDWDGALAVLASNESAGIVERDRARWLRAVLLTAKAMELEGGAPDAAREAALEATRLAPTLAPAAVVAARLATRAGDLRRASRVLEAAWKAEPHPDIASAYAEVRPGDSVLDRLKRVRKLADMRANHEEGAIAVARAAIAAHEWPAARAALEGLVKADPSERVCLLMADIEEGESGDLGRVRAWQARGVYAPHDPAWVADGEVFEAWAPVSPVSGRIDAYEWKVVTVPPASSRAIDLGWAEPEAPAETLARLPVPEAEEVEKAADDGSAAGETESSGNADKRPTTPEAEAGAEGDTAAGSGTAEAAPPRPDDPGPAAAVDDEDKARFRSI